MRVLVRDDTNQLYWKTGDEWVAEVAGARDFQTLHDAALKALENKARTTSVVLAYENPVCELVLNPHYCVELTTRRHTPP